MNPRIVYASITAFGQNGPYAKQRGYDMLAQAISGYMSINGFPDGPPTRSGQSISDYYAGMLHAFASSPRCTTATARATASTSTSRCSTAWSWPRQPRRALHRRRRDPHARGQRLVRRLELRRLSDDGRPRRHRGRRERRGLAALLRNHRPPRARPRSPVRDGARAPRPPRRVAAIIQDWTSHAHEVRGRADPRRRPACRRRRSTTWRRWSPTRRCRRARCSSSATTRRTESSSSPARRSRCRDAGPHARLAPLPGEHNEEIFVGLLGHSREDLRALARGGRHLMTRPQGASTCPSPPWGEGRVRGGRTTTRPTRNGERP